MCHAVGKSQREPAEIGAVLRGFNNVEDTNTQFNLTVKVK